MSKMRKDKVIFFVDDEPQVCKAVSQTLSTIGECRVYSYEDPKECLAELKRRSRCNLVITDVNMPELDGIAFLQEIKNVRPQLDVLLVTGYGDIPMAVRAVKAGALDFIEKPLDEATFLPIVKAALEKSGPGIPAEDFLTRAEIVVLKEIAKGKSNKQIAATLNRSVRTIENHRYRLMRKMEASNMVDLVKKAIKMGVCEFD